MSIFTIQEEIRREAALSDTKSWLRIDPWIASRNLALDWLGIVVALVLLSRMQTWWMFVLVGVWIGLRQYALFILGHDAIHGSLYPDHKVNDTVSRWLIHGPMFMGFEDGKRNHLEHHKFMGSAADPDRYIHVLSNKSTPFEFLFFCSGFATFVKTVLKVTPAGKIRAKSQQGVKAGELLAVLFSYAKERIPVFFAQILILSTFWLLGLPMWSYLLIWVSPIYFCVFLPDEIRAFAEHAVLSLREEETDDQRLVTFRPSLIEAAYFSPHQMNFHAEHHLWPRVPHYNLHRVYEGIKHRPEITLRRSYLGFIQQVVSFLNQSQNGVPKAAAHPAPETQP
jgi:fatty acid desaturase